jgi:hypothetical protein
MPLNQVGVFLAAVVVYRVPLVSKLIRIQKPQLSLVEPFLYIL